jgi:hypothetical protein
LTVIRKRLGIRQQLEHLWSEHEEALLNMARVLVLYYSTYGHIETMAHAVAEGAREAGAGC